MSAEESVDGALCKVFAACFKDAVVYGVRGICVGKHICFRLFFNVPNKHLTVWQGRARTRPPGKTGICLGNGTLTYISCSCHQKQFTSHSIIVHSRWPCASIQGEHRLVRRPHVLGIKLKSLKVFKRAASARPSIFHRGQSIHCHTAALFPL